MTIQDASSTSRPTLSQRWVERIFQVLQGNYGTRFTSQFSAGKTIEETGEDIGMVNAMRIWGCKLAGFSEHAEAISSVLDNLPRIPPTLPEFVELCREAARRINGSVTMLPHRMTPEESAKANEVAQAVRVAVFGNPRSPKEWAIRLKARHDAGETLLPVQGRLYQGALEID